MIEKDLITISVSYCGEVTFVNTSLHEYRNLMVLLNNTIFLENFGECGGQGRCATCVVKIKDLKGDARDMERNEAATLNKSGLHDVRLACQILINSDLNGATIEIPF